MNFNTNEYITVQETNTDGTYDISHYLNGLRDSSKDGPSVWYYQDTNTVAWEAWYRNGMLHRVDGPAVTKYSKDGKVTEEQWVLDGAMHRADGPAVTVYGNDKQEYYLYTGVRHATLDDLLWQASEHQKSLGE
ncbi:hypothetical protein J4G57_05385 [Aeromonas caviae]|uniref:hypothetical protein n=1 Tax=Aeromonas TaxID=642 RepID=UPI001BD40095|nr:hypothetical protein [Aeromonas caviae]MBS4707326.1 hypothetical protein [Aeromonas caviae]